MDHPGPARIDSVTCFPSSALATDSCVLTQRTMQEIKGEAALGCLILMRHMKIKVVILKSWRRVTWTGPTSTSGSWTFTGSAEYGLGISNG